MHNLQKFAHDVSILLMRVGLLEQLIFHIVGILLDSSGLNRLRAVITRKTTVKIGVFYFLKNNNNNKTHILSITFCRTAGDLQSLLTLSIV